MEFSCSFLLFVEYYPALLFVCHLLFFLILIINVHALKCEISIGLFISISRNSFIATRIKLTTLSEKRNDLERDPIINLSQNLAKR